MGGKSCLPQDLDRNWRATTQQRSNKLHSTIKYQIKRRDFYVKNRAQIHAKSDSIKNRHFIGICLLPRHLRFDRGPSTGSRAGLKTRHSQNSFASAPTAPAPPAFGASNRPMRWQKCLAPSFRRSAQNQTWQRKSRPFPFARFTTITGWEVDICHTVAPFALQIEESQSPRPGVRLSMGYRDPNPTAWSSDTVGQPAARPPPGRPQSDDATKKPAPGGEAGL